MGNWSTVSQIKALSKRGYAIKGIATKLGIDVDTVIDTIGAGVDMDAADTIHYAPVASMKWVK